MSLRRNFIILMTSLLFLSNITQAQLAGKKGITLTEIGDTLAKLADSKDEQSRARLAFEAKALVNSNDERYVTIGAKVFDFMGEKKKAAKIRAAILKRFPRGTTARLNVYRRLFSPENTSDGATIQKDYEQWLKQFPEEIEEDGKQQPIYSEAIANMAFVYFREGNMAKGKMFVDQARKRDNFAQYANMIGRKLIKDQNYDAALIVLEPGYDLAAEAMASSDPAIKNSNDARSYVIVAQNYIKVLKAKGLDKRLIDVLSVFVKTPFGSNTNNILDLAAANLRLGRKLDAFLAYDSYLRSPHIQGMDAKVIAAEEPLYRELNGKDASFSAYIAGIRASVDEVLAKKFETEMIKRPAPLFSVSDIDGNQVSLADLKGKVVVLEFWATWCSPCKRSMPGMQAVVNKYKDDKEVEFLFVDVFQKEPNYKELVKKFVTDHRYTFHVVFDKMNDPISSVAHAYGVNGIPHKVVIDKNGYIRFEGTGDLGDVDKTIHELKAKIELVRKNS